MENLLLSKNSNYIFHRNITPQLNLAAILDYMLLLEILHLNKDEYISLQSLDNLHSNMDKAYLLLDYACSYTVLPFYIYYTIQLLNRVGYTVAKFSSNI